MSARPSYRRPSATCATARQAPPHPERQLPPCREEGLEGGTPLRQEPRVHPRVPPEKLGAAGRSEKSSRWRQHRPCGPRGAGARDRAAVRGSSEPAVGSDGALSGRWCADGAAQQPAPLGGGTRGPWAPGKPRVSESDPPCAGPGKTHLR